MAPRTLGITDYDMDSPLKAVRRLMLESNGLITIAFRRILVIRGEDNIRNAASGDASSIDISGNWLTSPWAHIEPAMAYQMGLPIMVVREKGVRMDGMLEPGVAGIYLPSFETGRDLDDYFGSAEWTDLVWKWESQVRSVVAKKGEPPSLY